MLRPVSPHRGGKARLYLLVTTHSPLLTTRDSLLTNDCLLTHLLLHTIYFWATLYSRLTTYSVVMRRLGTGRSRDLRRAVLLGSAVPLLPPLTPTPTPTLTPTPTRTRTLTLTLTPTPTPTLAVQWGCRLHEFKEDEDGVTLRFVGGGEAR